MGAGQSRTSPVSGPSRTTWYDQETAAMVDCVFTLKEVKQLRKVFMKDHPSGIVSRSQFVDAYAAFFPFSDSSEIAHLIFSAMDKRSRDLIDFEQYLHALAMTQRGSEVQKVRFAFDVFDANADGVISRSEYEQIQWALSLLSHSSSSCKGSRTTGGALNRNDASCLARSSICGVLCTGSANAVHKATRRSTQATFDTSALTSTGKATSTAMHPASKRLSSIQLDTHYGSHRTVCDAAPASARVRPPLTPQPALNLSRTQSNASDAPDRRRSRLSPLSPSGAGLAGSPHSKLSRHPTLYNSGKEEYDTSSQSAYSDVSSESSPPMRYELDTRAISACSSFSDDEPEDVFAAMDGNADGVVDFNEFHAAVQRDPSLLHFLQFSG